MRLYFFCNSLIRIARKYSIMDWNVLCQLFGLASDERFHKINNPARSLAAIKRGASINDAQCLQIGND